MKDLGSKTLETCRLILKAQTMEEQKYLWQVLMLPEVNRYYLSIPKKYSEKLKDWNAQKAFYEEDMKCSNNLDVYHWSIFLKETGQCIGRCSAHDAKEENKKIDNPAIKGVGWYIDPTYHGKGYGTEAATVMMDFLFNDVGIEAIYTRAAINNPASWKIMEKLGFIRRKETIYVEYTYVDEPVEAYQYYLTKNDYFRNGGK